MRSPTIMPFYGPWWNCAAIVSVFGTRRVPSAGSADCASSANSLPAECLNGTRQPAQKQHFSTSQQSHPRVFANSSWSSSWPISNLSPSSPLPLGEGQGEGCCEKRTVLISEWESYSHPVRGNAGRQLHCRPNLSRTGQQRIWEVGSLSHADGRIFSPPFHSVDILTANRGRVKWFDAQTSVQRTRLR